MMSKIAVAILILLCAAQARIAPATEPVKPARSPHHVELGFFDIHVCNWSDRPLFFMALFSTTRFNEIAAIDILDPDGGAIGKLDLAQYRLDTTPAGLEKRVFMRQFPVAANAKDGWYGARITARDGRQTFARDFVVIARMVYVARGRPAPDAEDVPLPSELAWDAVAGAKHYQVFIQDLWESEKLIYTSPLLNEPRVVLPSGLLRKEGYYAWRVHARDVNEHYLLGDFNHGSLGPQMKFSVAP